jgi:positive control factor
VNQQAINKTWLRSIVDLKRSYRGTHRMLKRARDSTADPGEREIIEGMISDVNYSIEWMHTGKRPGNRRGIERRAAYQREKLMDPLRMQAFVHQHNAGSPANLSESQRFQIEMALQLLSERERECYTMAHGDCIPHADIARMLKITKGSVSQLVNRAQKKISEEVKNSLFFMK